MQTTTAHIGAESFDEWIARPENAGHTFELIGGEIVEKMVSRPLQSRIGGLILTAFNNYIAQNDIGRAYGADGGFFVGEDRYIPDASFISYARMPEESSDPYQFAAPDLAVEVVSPGDRDKDIVPKVVTYLAAGTAVWLVFPEAQEVQVFVAGQPVRKLGINDTLTGGDILPGFTLPLTTLFKQSSPPKPASEAQG
ncbi:Uma2 family endonuclease [bacterium]|nr:Uma2 family endonuclease [bacterium]